MARKKKHEEHANHEAWAIPYADLMTLLLAFFVVMYAISTVNEGKYRVMADALTAAFGGAPRTINPVQVGNHQLQGADFDRPSPIKSGAKQGPSAPSPSPNVTLLAAMASQMNMSLDAKGLQSAQGELKRIADDLERALAPLIDEKLVTIKRSTLWLEVQINSDILFATGSATLDPKAQETVGKLATVLAGVPNSVRVEGYTDDRPIRTAQFPSNWELSSARAASVVHLFVRDGIPPERLAMIGYGEFRPIADNASDEGRNANRRVLLIIVTQLGDVQNHLLFTERDYTASELTEAANFLNRHYAGQSLATITVELESELARLQGHIARLMSAAIDAGKNSLNSQADTVVVSGERNLLTIDELTSDLGSLRQLFDMFEHKTELLRLLSQSRGAQGVQLFIGDESGVHTLDGCSVVTAPYSINGQLVGTLGSLATSVIGAVVLLWIAAAISHKKIR